jgi:DNA mismatch endonuclease (patch repair protein)
MDKLTIAQRSEVMSRVRSEDTKPEMAVRSLIHRLGYRYRLHGQELPGKPDLVFPTLGKAIFVHGCFWHGHRCRSGRNRPSSNTLYWTLKLDGNKKRDRATNLKLRRLGWNVLVLWECELKNEALLQARIESFLGKRG